LSKSLNCFDFVKRRRQFNNADKARRWAQRLSKRVEEIVASHPSADRDNIRHTLVLLEQPPLERLQRSLIRGRATARKKDLITGKPNG
jgi:hypothetical protein